MTPGAAGEGGPPAVTNRLAEAAKPDMLRDLRYTLDFGPARLLGVPFVRSGDVWADAHFGLPARLA